MTTEKERKKGVLCKYFLHGACSKGESCTFKHELSTLPNLVCTHWLKGSCAYGDACRYDHQHPDYAPRVDRTKVAGYIAPPKPKPAIDDLSEMPPISQLRLGGAFAGKSPSFSPADVSEQDNSSAASSAESALGAALQAQARRCPPPVGLPNDPFNGGGSRDAHDRSKSGGGGGSCTSIEDGLPDDLDLVIDALEHTTLNVDSELIAAAAAAEEQAALDREQHLQQQQQQHWATSGSIGSGGGADYYGSEGIEAREKPNKYNEEAVYEAGVYNYHPSGDILPPPEGLAGFENHHHQQYEEAAGQGHHEGYFVEDEDGANIDAYYDQHDQQYSVDPNHPHWHQQQLLQHEGGGGDQQTGSVYGSYGTGGHSSGGEYGAFGSAGTSPGMTTRFSAGNGSMPAWHIPGGGNGNGSDGGWGAGGSTGDLSRFYASPALQSLCWEYYNHGVCSQQHEGGAEGDGGQCQMAHGEWCETCNHYALHPVDMNAREAHIIECRARHDRLEAIRRSAHVECGICMERVIEKAIPAERRFGLLNCEHAFCLSCIRNWRQQYSTGVDVEQALRTCPICRTAAHFITPTSVWPATAEEREAIISGYKTKLQEIDCRHFNFGEGSCPFGTSCMYRHAYPDGRLEESAPRRVAADEGDVRMVQPVRLSDFIVVQRGKVRGRRR